MELYSLEPPCTVLEHVIFFRIGETREEWLQRKSLESTRKTMQYNVTFICVRATTDVMANSEHYTL